MQGEIFAQQILSGRVEFLDKEINIAEEDWNPHPAFPGVYLKNLITGANSNGRFSSHLVKVQENYELGEHIHEGKWEIHEVVGGSGRCYMEGKEIDYSAGVCTVIPENIKHRVISQQGDLYILAKFIPALI